ncbi:lysozyme [Clostridium sp. CAG:590]|jgi:GH24 family phage-related lysozyme (muramidase)|nr:lysozyme [Clostridium sp. CAG:590]
MKISTTGLNLIKSFEGCRLTAYKCPAGVWTIGYGHTGNVKSGQKITQAKAESYLKSDLAKFEKHVMSYDKKYNWNQNEFDALVSFAYNIGSITQLTANGTRTKKQISEKILAYDKAAGKTLAGLIRRRQAEKALFDKPVAKKSTTATKKSTTLKKGDRIRIKAGAKDLNTKGKYASFVYKTTYIIHSIKDKKVVFGNGSVIVGKVKESDCYKV